MTALQILENKGNAAVKSLRSQKLANGRPFMINSNDLPDNQCYLEYPDGAINLVCLPQGSKEFTIIRTLSTTEAQLLRKRFGLA